jgi:hypothetical protein
MGVAKRAKIWFNKEMSINSDTNLSQVNTPESEVEGLRRLVEEQRKLIDKLVPRNSKIRKQE